MKSIILFISFLGAFGFGETGGDRINNEKLNLLAEKYVRLGLTIGEYDNDFVDAYYGPDSLRPTVPKQAVFPRDRLLVSVNQLIAELKEFNTVEKNDTLRIRANWMSNQLIAFGRRIKIFSGEYRSFDEESKELYGVVAPSHPEKYFQLLVTELDSLLPGIGSIAARFQKLAAQFIIPKNKLDTVFKISIAESRKRTLEHYSLPPNESFTLEYVSNKPWGGYNWYKGNYKSDIQINTDLNIFIDWAIDLASHESYPGHHVYNMLLEKNLYHDMGWIEISLYPLFSPQSLIAEGTANYGIEMAFPGQEKARFAREILLPLAGLDTAGINRYFRILALKEELNYARTEIGRGFLNGAMSEKEALRWLMDYNLSSRPAALKFLSFVRKNRSYVINFSYSRDLVKDYIESRGGKVPSTAKRWELFYWLLSNEVMPADLLKVNK
jgi:hypothetical protein